MNTKDFSVEIKSIDDGGELIAYASTFDRIPDSYGDVVAHGAFTKSLEKWRASGNPIPLLFGHRTDDPSMNIGAVYNYEEDLHGLKVYARFDADSDTAQYCRKLVKEGRLSKLSFAYAIKDYSFVDIDGKECRELKELDIYEVSLVPIPANQYAEVIDAKDGEDVAEYADAPVLNDHSDDVEDVKGSEELTEEKSIEEAEQLAEELNVELSDVLNAIQGIKDAITPAIDELSQNFKSLYDVITKAATDADADVLTDSEQPEVKEGDSETETADVVEDVQDNGPVEEVEEKGAPDEELLAKMTAIFELGA